MTSTGRAQLVGTGLIGGSIGLALRREGWLVTGRDRDAAAAERALELGAVDAIGDDPSAEISFVATPVSAIAEAARGELHKGGVVTDVGSVKGPVVAAVGHASFVGGHPMAGSEQDGVDGADADLFTGATWVLTPTEETDPEAFARLRAVVSSLGADVVSVPPDRHDALVAVVSHVPHLTAASLMSLAAAGAEEHATLLRLAAGGFRDMTRIASGSPAIWPDICAENRDAIVDVLDRFVESLGEVREAVASADRAQLLSLLERARVARVNLPARAAARAEELAEVRVPVPDRKGVAAELTTLAADLGVDLFDFEIAHSAEGTRGVMVLVVDAAAADLLRGAYFARGYRPTVTPLAT